MKLCKIFTYYLDENKNESFLNMINVKLSFFNHSKLKFQPRT